MKATLFLLKKETGKKLKIKKLKKTKKGKINKKIKKIKKRIKRDQSPFKTFFFCFLFFQKQKTNRKVIFDKWYKILPRF
jgi:hypothetical protein